MSNTINLLAPSTSINTRVKSQKPNKYLIGGCIFAVLITVGIYGALWGLNWKVNNQISRVEAGLDKLAPAAKQEVRLDSARAELEQTIKVINRLKAEKPKLSGYLDELARVIPATVSLFNLEIRQQPFEVNISGTAPSQTEVAQFGSNLQRSRLFGDSIIQFTEKRGTEKVVTFSISITPEEDKGDNK